MGQSSAPRSFLPATPFGQTPPTPVTTETQPLALNTGTQTPAMSGYQLQMKTPITSPMAQPADDGSGMSPQDRIAQLRAQRANGGMRPMPFYG